MLDLSAQRKDLRPLALLRPHGSEPIRAVQDNLAHVRVSLHVIEKRRLAEQPLVCGEGRTRAGLAAVSLDAGHERGLFAADERAGAQTDLHVEGEIRPEDIVPQKSVFTRRLDGLLQALHRNRIFRADIDVALIGPDRVCGDRHRLDQAVRIALQYRAVHKRARIAFVRVAGDKLFVADRTLGEIPFHPGGESAAPSAAQPGGLDRIDDVVRRHFKQHLAQRLIAVERYVFFDALGIDPAAVAEGDPVLFFVKRRAGEGFYRAVLSQRLFV